MAPARKTRKGEDFVLPCVSKASDFKLDVQTVDHDNREALKSMWTQKPAVLVTTDDKVMQAFKVVKAKSGAFEVHFSTSPTGGLRDDVKMKSMDLWARAPRPGLKHIILGAVGGEFRGWPSPIFDMSVMKTPRLLFQLRQDQFCHAFRNQ